MIDLLVNHVVPISLRLIYALTVVLMLLAVRSVLVNRWTPKTPSGYAALTRFQNLFLELSGYVVVLIGFALAGFAFGTQAGIVATLVGFGSLGFSLFVNSTMSGIVDGVSNRLTALYKVDDELEIDGEIMRVQAIGSRATQCLLEDGSNVSLPNSYLANTRVRNITEEEGYRQFVRFCVDDDTPAETVKAVIASALQDAQLSYGTHHANCIWAQFGQSGREFDAVIWMKSAFGARINIDKACDSIEAAARKAKISLGYTSNVSFKGSKLAVEASGVV